MLRFFLVLPLFALFHATVSQIIRLPIEQHTVKIQNRLGLFRRSELISNRVIDVGIPFTPNHNTIFFTVNITVGTPPQPLTIWFSFLPNPDWPNYLDSAACKYCDDPRYNHSASSTYIPDGEKYLDKQFTGFYSKDRLCFGEACTKTRFVELRTVAPSNLDTKTRGAVVLKLFNDKSKRENIIQELYEQRSIYSPIVSYWRNRNEKSKIKGQVIFGEIDMNLYVEPITWTNITNEGQTRMRFNIQKMAFGDVKTNCTGRCSVDMLPQDRIIGPSDVINEINKILDADCSGGGLCEVECRKMWTFPDFVLTIEGREFRLTADYFIVKAYDLCLSLFVGGNKNWTLDDSLIQKYYTVIDFGKNRIGFAESQEL